MIGIDTNVLVRYLVRDDAAQFERARRRIHREADEGAGVLISLLVVLETEWVLRSRYQLPKMDILGAFSALLDSADVSFEDEPSLEESLYLWKDSSADFADCLITARHRRLGCSTTATFDAKALKLIGFVAVLERLSPLRELGLVCSGAEVHRQAMIAMSAATGQVLALSMLSGIGPATLLKIASLPNFERTTPNQWAAHVPALERALNATGAWPKALEQAEEQVEWARRVDARILSPLDDAYPPLLTASKDDPFLLFVRGRLAPGPFKSVAIIGTREPTEHGEAIAQRIAQYSAERYWSIVSGLAVGCDAIAHSTAL